MAPPQARDSGRAVVGRGRATRRTREPPSDAEIERGLREKAVTDPRAAEILLRWLQRPRQDNPPGVDLDAMSEAQLERLHAGLVKLASMDEPVLAALVEQVLTDDELAPALLTIRSPRIAQSLMGTGLALGPSASAAGGRSHESSMKSARHPVGGWYPAGDGTPALARTTGLSHDGES
jgi:hypothetical protein